MSFYLFILELQLRRNMRRSCWVCPGRCAVKTKWSKTHAALTIPRLKHDTPCCYRRIPETFLLGPPHRVPVPAMKVRTLSVVCRDVYPGSKHTKVILSTIYSNNKAKSKSSRNKKRDQAKIETKKHQIIFRGRGFTSTCWFDLCTGTVSNAETVF